eukprot:jgi/Botrbrau1/23217/Bobra.0041s0061.1
MMDNKITVTPLYGAEGSGAISILLDVQGIRILLDCGWTDSYDEGLLKPLIEVIPTLDVVLLSQPDPEHIGALPYLVAKHGLEVPIYATGALHKMGQMFLYAQVQSHHQNMEFQVFTLDDVDVAFERITTLKYQQNAQLSGKAKGFTVTPFQAGHLLGGALWRINTPQQEQLVYAVDLNQRRERHLGGCMLEVAASRPLLLISDARAVDRPHVDPSKRDRLFLEAMLQTLRRDGSVLIPVDAAGRLLELLLILEEAWASKSLPYPLVLLSPVAHTTLRFTRSQLEWMNESVVKLFGTKRGNPFALKHVKLCSKREQVDKLEGRGKVVLAPLASLEAGFSRNLLFDWGPNPANLVLLLGRSPEGTVAAALQYSAENGGGAAVLKVQRSWRIPLTGAELDAWREEREKAAALAAPQPQSWASDSDEEDNLQQLAVSTSFRGAIPTRTSVGSIGKVVTGFGGRRLVSRSAQPHVAGKTPSTATLLDGFVSVEDAAGPLFPFEDEDEKLTWDPYGCNIIGSKYQPRVSLPPLENGGVHRPEENGNIPTAPDDDEEEEEEEELPTKLVTAETSLTVRARVMCFDMEGRCDGRSLRTLLVSCAPRNLILLQGPSQVHIGPHPPRPSC